MFPSSYIPIRRHATADDFKRWESKAETMTDYELRYAAKECREVAALWRGHDGMVEGFYDDQASTYGTVLRRRQLARL
jgi:hypothetical protein